MSKFIYYPYKPSIYTQKFGESKLCVPANGIFPASKRKPIIGKGDNGKCPVGYEELYPLLGDGQGNFMKGHTGIDLVAPRGKQPVCCPVNGTVIEVCTEVERGLGVGVVTDEQYLIEGGLNYQKVRMWHLMSIGDNIRVGTKVTVGDIIGYPDSTGLSTGDHIHFELKPVKRINTTNEDTSFANILQDNGYFGAIDPAPYWIGKYAIDEAQISLLQRIITLYNSIIDLLKKKRLGITL